MSYTFGIITAGDHDPYIETAVAQIRKQQIPTYEIIIVGQTSVRGPDILNLPFDETVKKGWITRKKNMIANAAKHEILVLMHDYVSIADDWYEGFQKFGTDFDMCIHPIEMKDGRRFRDLTFFHCFNHIPFNLKCLIPYDYPLSEKLSKLLYVSGTFYIIKRDIALQLPLDESLVHDMGEDVMFSILSVINGFSIKFNPYSKATLLKEKEFPSSEFVETKMLQWLEERTVEEISEFVHINLKLQRKWIEQKRAISS